MPGRKLPGAKTQFSRLAQRLPGSLGLPTILPFLYPFLYDGAGLQKEQSVVLLTRRGPYKPFITGGQRHERHQSQLRTVPCNKDSFNGLMPASACQKGTVSFSASHQRLVQTHKYHRPRRKVLVGSRQIHNVHTTALTTRPLFVPQPTREELLYLVDTYREFHSTQATLNDVALSARGQWHYISTYQENRPLLMEIPSKETTIGPSVENIEVSRDDRQPDDSLERDNTSEQLMTVPSRRPENATQHKSIGELNHTIQRPNCTHNQAFDVYSKLPKPGVAFLDRTQIRLLFRCLSTIERKTKQTALQYLSVVEDMKVAGLPMQNGEWNSAIAFCGQCYSHVRDENIENALESWKEMEQQAGTKAGVVTFNILFDMAAKSGKFVLAEMILREMHARGLEPNRYSRVSKIYFYGLRGDGDSVRRAYKELVDAKEVVDTVVLNCVIAALIAAGELASAEHVFGRMKQLLADRTGEVLEPPIDWMEGRELGRLFDHLARENRSKIQGSMQRSLRRRISFAPNLHTFAIFIEHHASETGDLRRICALLGEMRLHKIAVHGRIFLKLFKGFATHGAQVYSDWTSWRLRKVYQSLLDELDHEAAAAAAAENQNDDVGGRAAATRSESIQIRQWLVVWIVRAFNHCAGREWALQVWQELLARWNPSARDLEMTHRRLSDVLGLDPSQGQKTSSTFSSRLR